MTFYQRIWIYWPVMSTQYILVDLIPIDWMLTFYQYFLVGLLPTNWKLTYCQVDFLQTHLWNLPSSVKIYSFFYIVGLKKILSQKSICYEKSRYLLMWKDMAPWTKGGSSKIFRSPNFCEKVTFRMYLDTYFFLKSFW